MAEMNGQMNAWKNYLITKQKIVTTKKITFKSVVVNLLGLEAKERLENWSKYIGRSRYFFSWPAKLHLA